MNVYSRACFGGCASGTLCVVAGDPVEQLHGESPSQGRVYNTTQYTKCYFAIVAKEMSISEFSNRVNATTNRSVGGVNRHDGARRRSQFFTRTEEN
jgi:hypothetical protein